MTDPAGPDAVSPAGGPFRSAAPLPAVRSGPDWPAGRVLVQAATYNERDNILGLIDAVLAVAADLQLLVIDDDSPDGTGRLVMERAGSEPRVHLLMRQGRRGLGSAMLEGFAEARRHGFEVVVNMDADFSHDPADIPRLVAALDGPAPPGSFSPDDRSNSAVPAIAIGSRRVPGGAVVGWPWSRHLASGLVGWFTRRILRVPVRDPSSGFRAVRLDLFDRLSGPFAAGYAFQEDLLWRAHRAGAGIVEVPITFTDRTRGASKAGLAESCRSIGDLLVLARRTWLGL